MKKKTSSVWVVTGKSESGDDYGPVVFEKKPSDIALSEMCHEWDGNGTEDGPGSYGSYVHLSVEECVIN